MNGQQASIYVVLGSGLAVNHLQFWSGIEGHAKHKRMPEWEVCVCVSYLHDMLIKCHKKLRPSMTAGRAMRRIRVKINCRV